MRQINHLGSGAPGRPEALKLLRSDELYLPQNSLTLSFRRESITNSSHRRDWIFSVKGPRGGCLAEHVVQEFTLKRLLAEIDKSLAHLSGPECGGGDILFQPIMLGILTLSLCPSGEDLVSLDIWNSVATSIVEQKLTRHELLGLREIIDHELYGDLRGKRKSILASELGLSG